MKSRGLTLLEIMIAISLLAVVGLVIPQLFRGAMTIHRDTTAAHDALSRTQRLDEQLQRDAWRAAAIEPAEAGLRLIAGDGTMIVWRVEEETTLVRESADEQQRWRMDMPLRLEREGPSVNLKLGAPETDRTASRRFVSQILLAKEGR